MDQSGVANDRVASPTSPKIPPPLPPNPPRTLPPGTGRRTSASSSSLSLSSLTSPAPTDKLPRQDMDPLSPTVDSTSKIPPPRPVPPDPLRASVSPSSPAGAASAPVAFSVYLRSTPVRQPSGSLLGIGRRNAMLHSTEVKAEDGTVYRRNASGVYFQIEQAWTSFDGSNGLEVGDEVLAVDNYKMVDMSLDTAR